MVSDLLVALEKLPPAIFSEWSGTQSVRKWDSKMRDMRAVDSLASDDAQQMRFDLDKAYNDWHTKLEDVESQS